jgi:hypothetical protein
VLSSSNLDGKGVWLNPESGRMTQPAVHSPVPLSWLPNNSIAKLWQQLHQPARLPDLLRLPPKPRLAEVLHYSGNHTLPVSEHGESQTVKIRLEANPQGRVTISDIHVSGAGFSLANANHTQLPAECEIIFSPRQLPWGPRRGTLRVTGQVNGQDAEPLEIDLNCIIRGAVGTNPSTLYLGVVKSGGVMERDIKLVSRLEKINIQSVTVPNADNFRFQQSEQGEHLILRMKWHTGPRLGTVHQVIQIQFADPEPGALHIPVIGFVEKP